MGRVASHGRGHVARSARTPRGAAEDPVAPPFLHQLTPQARSAYDLKQEWDDIKLQIVDDAGHSAREPGITKLLVEAADEFGKTLKW